MIKWSVLRYLNKKLDYVKHQILSLETELGYNNNLDSKEILSMHNERRIFCEQEHILKYVIKLI